MKRLFPLLRTTLRWLALLAPMAIAVGSASAFFLWTLDAVTLSAGFKGGEVTPLFFIGAALGNSLALVLGAPIDLIAALGFVAIFAGATNTPLTSTFLGMELFGAGNGLYIATACIIAYRCSGAKGIYSAQRLP